MKYFTPLLLSLATVLIFHLALSAHGEVFLGSTTSSNRFLIASNEAVLIYRSTVAEAFFVRDGVTNQLRSFDAKPLEPCAFAGPAEMLIVTPGMISFKRLFNSGIRTIFISPTTTNAIEIPSGKTARFFRATTPSGINPYELSFEKEGVVVDQAGGKWEPVITGGEEYQGPLKITIRNDRETWSVSFSYYFIEDFLTVPELGFLQGPTGSFEITVEKSGDLTNWTPVIIQPTSNDQKAFYRLKLSR